MECDICSKQLGSNRQPLCVGCARTSLYGPRIEHLSVLLERERLHGQIETRLKSPASLQFLPPGASTIDLTASSVKLDLERCRSQVESLDDRMSGIREQQQLLKEQIRQAREDNASRKRSHKARRDGIRQDVDQLRSRKFQLLDPIQNEAKRLRHKIGKVHTRTKEGRVKLCRESVGLAGLTMRKRRCKDGRMKEEYLIGGIPITDLRELNSMF